MTLSRPCKAFFAIHRLPRLSFLLIVFFNDMKCPGTICREAAPYFDAPMYFTMSMVFFTHAPPFSKHDELNYCQRALFLISWPEYIFFQKVSHFFFLSFFFFLQRSLMWSVGMVMMAVQFIILSLQIQHTVLLYLLMVLCITVVPAVFRSSCNSLSDYWFLSYLSYH